MGSDHLESERGTDEIAALLTGGPANAFEEAVHAHEQWKAMFARAIRDGGSGLTTETVSRDDQCLLGRWLYGGATTAVANPAAFTMLRDVHAEFHKAATAVLSLALAGKRHAAVRSLEPGEPYGQWSAILVVALMRYVGSAGEGTGERASSRSED